MPAVYTSITLAYLAKARVLARSVKRYNPAVKFYLVLVEPAPEWLRRGIDARTEPFDVVLTTENLAIPRVRSWLYQHNVVEACTGVKGPALDVLFADRGEEKVLYLDPDVVVFSPLDPLFAHLDSASILLTPHCPVAETALEPIIFNEISSLAHGVYNLGFIGVASDSEGRRFAGWWRHRLYHFCHDDIPRGLFTDQRWADLIPAQFERVRILRDPVYNAASWNVTQRLISGSVPDDVRADGAPLCFYHFSGVNSGIPERMYSQFGIDSRAVADLIRWYRAECERNGESELARSRWHYANYADGTPITRAQRLVYRTTPDLQERFPDPFASGPGSYHHWLATDGPGLEAVEQQYAESVDALRLAANRLAEIERTWAYKLYTRLARFAHPFRMRFGRRARK